MCVCVRPESVPPRRGSVGGDVRDAGVRLRRHGDAPRGHAGDDPVQRARPTP